MAKASIREMINYLISIGTLTKDDYPKDEDVSSIDCSLIATLYDLKHHQLKVIHYDPKTKKEWRGYAHETYEQMLERTNILNQPVDASDDDPDYDPNDGDIFEF